MTGFLKSSSIIIVTRAATFAPMSSEQSHVVHLSAAPVDELQ